MSPPRFNFNVSFSEPVNRPGDEPALTLDDVWRGLDYGGRHPHEMAEYVAACEVYDESADGRFFRRRLTLGGGAVHTGEGEKMEQEVILRPLLNVRFFFFSFFFPFFLPR